MLGRKNQKAVARPINNNCTFSLFQNTPSLVLGKKLSCQNNKSANQTVKEEKKENK